jgi:hypothetical protein
MNKSQYLFGYLFVRFSRLVAAATILVTFGSIFYLWQSYSLKVESLKYHPSSVIDLQCSLLADEFEFAKLEVSRIGSVGDLPKITFSRALDDSAKLEGLLNELDEANQRKAVLKARVTTVFTDRIELLRKRIKNTIDSIEASRAAAAPNAYLEAQGVQILERRSTVEPLADQHRTVYGELSPNQTQSMRGSMEGISKGLTSLAASAEKEESKKLIQEAKAALNDLLAWLPSMHLEKMPSLPPEEGAVETAAPADPLIKAQENYDMLAGMKDVVRSTVEADWQLDGMLLETTRLVENEARTCRASEGALKELRLSSLGYSTAYLFFGVALAFLILVFADFLRSLFDTASNSASIVCLLEKR